MAYQEYSDVLLAIEDGVAKITLNRPDKLNAMNGSLIRHLTEIFREIANDAAVRVVVIGSTKGCKAFVAGADIEAFTQMTPTEYRHYISEFMQLGQLMGEIDQPVISAVDGYCFGGGCTLAFGSDMVLATKRSKFALLETNIGIIGNASALTRVVGRQKASELAMLAPVFPAEEAYRLNIVNRVVEDDQALEEAVQDICKQICGRSPAAMAMTKRTIRRALDAGLNDAIDYEADASVICFQTEECKKAFADFVEKTKK